MVEGRTSVFGTFESYKLAFQENLNGPIPFCVGKSEDLCTNFLRGLDVDGHFAAMKLISFAYGGIRSSTALCLAGATPAVPSVLRASLEAMAYALLFERQPEWAKIWRERHEAKKSKYDFRNNSGSALRKQLKNESAELSGRYNTLYNLLIDFGAHPNVLGVDSTIGYRPLEDGNVYVSFQQLTGAREREFAFVNITQATIFLLDILSVIWPTRASLFLVKEKQIEIIRLMHEYAPK